jgi:hypothetical protein
MRLALVLTAVLLAALGAGCVGAPGQAMTARDALGDATDTATKWADGKDLHLVVAAAIEPFKHATYDSPDGKEHAEYETRLDGNPGDGKAPGWLYGFMAGDRCITVVEAAGLGVLADGYETCGRGQRDLEPLGDWSFDSDAIAAVLHDNKEWPQPTDAMTYTWALGSHDGRAVWSASAFDVQGNRTVAVVDAQNGTVLAIASGDDADQVSEAFPVGGQSGAAGRDGLTKDHDEAHAPVVAEAPLQAKVHLHGKGGFVSIQANLQASLGAVGTVQLTLTGPDGVVDSHVFPGIGGASQYQTVLDNLPPGTYTLDLHTTVGAAVEANLFLDGAWA